ncbi:MAG: hypothetical protein ACE149_17570 [Armatimonadota bacterium]
MKHEAAVGNGEPSRRPVRKSDLSTPRQRLVVSMRELGCGRVEELVKHGGEPEWTPPPRLVNDVIIGKRSRSHHGQGANFTLKDHVSDFFRHFDEAPEGARFTIFVQDGLPFRFLMVRPN